MGNQYKIIVSNNKIFKEVEIPAEANEFSIGTELGCDVRLRKDMFFNQFQITFIRNGDNWTVVCSDNIYFTDDGIRKLMTKSLVHGDILEVRYQLADNELLRLEFLIDFARGNITYNRAIDVSTANALRIGNEAGCDISISSNLVNGDIVELVRKGDDFAISKDQTVYGIYINDKKASVGAVIENGSFFSISDFFFYYKNGKLWTEKRTGLRTELPHVDSYMPDYYPAIRRSTRLKKAIDETPIQILDPPSKMEKPKNNLLMRLMPSLGMFAASAAMACIGGYMVICSAISGVMAVITAIMSVRETNKDYKKSIADRQEKYTNYIERKREEIKDLREEEKEILEGTYISSEKEESLFREFSPDLFDRTPADADFMCVRLGTGSRTAGKIINYKKQEVLEVEDELQGMPETLSKEFRDIENAPVTCDLKAINALGITGPEQARFDLLKNIVIDLAARHYQKDLKMVFIAAEEHRNRIRWLRTLPHVYNQSEGTRNIVCDEEGRTAIFEYLLKEMTERQEAEEKREHLVVFVYDEYGFNKHPVSRFVSCAAELGVTFLFFGQNRYSLSQGCNTIIEIGEENSAKLISMSDGQSSSEFTYRTVDDRTAKAIVDLLTPLYTEEVSLESSLTKNISLFELMNIIAVDDINLEERWNNSMVYKSMAAPIGVSTNRVVELDLHDKFHGPHGLVAGTTGSGKSEILQTYVLAMATLFHPYEVGFVIIDFKGGGMANQFDGLPHMMGTITNIDGREIERSLKSIKAELRKRQEYFSEAGVNHIDKYIKKYKEGEVRNPLPHLIIIVDEFAELKADQPEFMKELISAARIGRSLGVHLILATQKPAGQVDEQIWSNSRFKLCLKVQTTEDSKEVLKSPLAAEIKEPGRAYLQVGNNEIFELFQSAYSGAPEKEATMGLREFKIFSLSDSGKRTPVFAQKNQVADGDNTTQLTAIVDYVHDYFEGLNMPKLPDICLPSLEHVIDFPEGLAAHRSGSDIIADIGIFDDPDSQIQEQYSINLSKQNVLMIGSAQSGKTNILQTMIRSLASKYTPEEVNIYVIDFASMILRSFEGLKHIGGVVTPTEDEKLKNLIKMLQEEIESRREKLLELGVSSLSAYREAGKTDLPQIVLMIDNYTALRELYFEDDDEFIALCRDGLTVGISIVLSNSNTSRIGYKYLSNFSSRIACFCNDSGEYSSLFEHCRMTIDDIHGRCIIEREKNLLECQSYLAFKGEKEIDRVNSIKEFIADINGRYDVVSARMIPVIPEVISTQFVEEKLKPAFENRFSTVLGYDYDSVQPLVLNLAKMKAPLVVSGREGSGRHNFMKYVVDMLNTAYPGETRTYILDGIEKKLEAVKTLPGVKAYEFMPENIKPMITDIEHELKMRYERVAEGTSIPSDSELIVLMINNSDVFDIIENDMDINDSYDNITSRYKNMNVCVIIGDYENTNISYTAPRIVKDLKDNEHFMFFEDVANIKALDLPLSLSRKFKKPISTGDCFYISENDCYRLKTVLSRF